MDRDEEIGKVVTELTALIDELHSTVEALAGTLRDPHPVRGQDKGTGAPA